MALRELLGRAKTYAVQSAAGRSGPRPLGARLTAPNQPFNLTPAFEGPVRLVTAGAG